MENSTATPAPVTPVELLRRQLHDWHTLKRQLEAKNQEQATHDTYNHITYCDAKIDELQTELAHLLQ